MDERMTFLHELKELCERHEFRQFVIVVVKGQGREEEQRVYGDGSTEADTKKAEEIQRKVLDALTRKET